MALLNLGNVDILCALKMNLERLERALNLLGISDGVGVACECCCAELLSYKSRSGYF